MKKLKYILYLVVAMLAMTACSDELVAPQTDNQNPLNQDKGIGQLVLFSSGSSGNTTTRAVIPYMEQEGRFVCKMYYHAKATDTDASAFDVENTPITSWLRVNNKEGNSVYWNREFRDLTDADLEDPNYKDYGFDPNAQFFYWRNRLDHIFLAYTDFNLLKTNKWELSTNTDKDGNTLPRSRALFMYPEADGEKKTKTGTKPSWETYNYKKMVFATDKESNPDFDKDKFDAYKAYEENPEKWEDEHPYEPVPEPYTVPSTIDVLKFEEFETTTTYPMTAEYEDHFPISGYYSSPTITKETIEDTQKKVIDLIKSSTLTDEQKVALEKDLKQESLYSDEEETAEGTFHNGRWWVAYKTDAFDAEGKLVDFNKILVYQLREKKKIEDVIEVAPANVFDLTRKPIKNAPGTYEINSINEQPDPLIAYTKMKPTGATQEANRVRLYFKHQFSQIQVNLMKGENTPDIKPENILSVELLGVTEKGYVFTNINKDGTQIPPTYDPVVKSKFTAEQLKDNEHGTSFNMFKMDDDAKPLTSLRSFNAIAFGQLQAIRITWKEDDYEEDEETKAGVKHVATYAITIDDRGHSLKNLQSGYRYVYDFELRRGTIAFIRAVIDGWQLSDDLNYGTSGIIDNSTSTN